jgi:hypothetical protein
MTGIRIWHFGRSAELSSIEERTGRTEKPYTIHLSDSARGDNSGREPPVPGATTDPGHRDPDAIEEGGIP